MDIDPDLARRYDVVLENHALRDEVSRLRHRVRSLERDLAAAQRAADRQTERPGRLRSLWARGGRQHSS